MGAGVETVLRVRPRHSVRVRILVWVLLMATLGLGVTGVTLFTVQAARVDAAAGASLKRGYQEVMRLANAGVDPETGEPFHDVRSFLIAALQQHVPEPYQTYLALVGGEPFGYPAGDRVVALESETTALAAIRAVPAGAPVQVADVDTSAGRVRLAIMSVQVVDEAPAGTFVIAHAIALEQRELRGLAGLYAALSALSLLVIGLVGWWVTGRIVQPLARLRAASARTSAADLGVRIPVEGQDEVADVTLHFNEMLDRLQQNFVEQRQFMDDLGHEMQTPLTVILGHLDVVDPTDPDAVIKSRDLVADEAERMSRLVEDLITLAKAGRPDFLHTSTFEAADLTVDIAEKARVLGDRRWVIDGVAEGLLQGDPQRLTQAALQLAHNAVRYSEPGSEIGIGSERVGGEVLLRVRDQGRGIPAAEADSISERFARGDRTGSVEGSGLGLAIVRAIALAHHGRVAVDSVPGVGSVFTIAVPATSPPIDVRKKQ